MHMREAAKANAAISSPEWALGYIRRLEVAWMTWLMYEHADEAKWVQTGRGLFGKKVAVHEAEDVAAGRDEAEPAG